jgi:hypothetical protein
MPFFFQRSHGVVQGAVAAAVISATSHAAVVITFSEAFIGQQDFKLLDNPGSALVGTVTGITMDAVLTQSSSPSLQARYSMLYFGAPIAGFLATVGSPTNPFPFPTWVNPQWYSWADGASGAIGTPLTARIDFTQPFGAGSISSLGIALPNAATGEWMRLTGSLTLHGVELVPAPGALALLGLAGFARSRRR